MSQDLSFLDQDKWDSSSSPCPQAWGCGWHLDSALPCAFPGEVEQIGRLTLEKEPTIDQSDQSLPWGNQWVFVGITNRVWVKGWLLTGAGMSPKQLQHPEAYHITDNNSQRLQPGTLYTTCRLLHRSGSLCSTAQLVSIPSASQP